MKISPKENSKRPYQVVDDSQNEAYRFTEYLASGSYGDCGLLQDNQGQKYVAKFALLSNYHSTHHQQSLFAELIIHRSLKHINIVNFHSSFVWKDYSVMLMDFCPHGTLQQLVLKRKKLTMFETKFFAKQLLSGLSYIHSSNIIHGDIKPANVFLGKGLRPKIGDFGLSSFSEDGSKNRCVGGTPLFMAPESFMGVSSYKTDIWAFGCTVYLMNTGCYPFTGRVFKDVIDGKRPIRVPYKGVYFDKPMKQLYERLFDRDPSKRPTALYALNKTVLKHSYIPKALPMYCLKKKPSKRQIQLIIKKYRNNSQKT